MDPVPVRLASTVIPLRDGPSGPEVFLVQRNRRSGFLPNAWVFPGGRVESSDANVRVSNLAGLGRVSCDDLALHAVAGLRETMEESGLWLGGAGGWPAEAVDASGLVPWSRWVTPEIEARRFDTLFFVARAEGEGRHDEAETVASGWFSPRDIVHGGTALPLAPPTWWTLFELAPFDDVAAILVGAESRRVSPIRPILQFGDAGIVLLLPGHPEHPDGPQDGLPDRVDYEAGSWVATRQGVRIVVRALNT